MLDTIHEISQERGPILNDPLCLFQTSAQFLLKLL